MSSLIFEQFLSLPFPPPLRRDLQHVLINAISAVLSSFPDTIKLFTQEQFNIIKLSLDALRVWREYELDGPRRRELKALSEILGAMYRESNIS